MELSEKLTLASWFIVPAITTVVAYYQQRSAQRQLDEKTRLRDIHDLLDSLQQDSTNYWILSGASIESTQCSIKIKNTLKKLEQIVPEDKYHLLSDLRMEITGGVFDNPIRVGLAPTHEKFREIARRVTNVRQCFD